MDFEACELKYKHLFKYLGTKDVDTVKNKIKNEVIPNDIH